MGIRAGKNCLLSNWIGYNLKSLRNVKTWNNVMNKRGTSSTGSMTGGNNEGIRGGKNSM